MRRANWGPVAVSTLLLVASLSGVATGLDVSGPFIDDDFNQHEANINAISLAGITAGCGERLYCPRSLVTRAEMATFLQRALKLVPTSSGPFTDVAGNPHEQAINAIAAAGISIGCAPGLYCPGAPVARDQMASFLVRGLRLAPRSAGPFSDIAGNVHEQAINAVAAAAITLGCGGGRYCPGDLVTRDQMATFVARALKLAPVYPQLPLSSGLALRCTKDGLACSATATVPYRARYNISEGFYHALPYQSGEEAAVTSAATRLDVTVDGQGLGLTPLPVDTSSGRAQKLFAGELTLAPGIHTMVARWLWNGSLTLTHTITVVVTG